MLKCPKCRGMVMIDGAETDGHLELFCIRCSKRWEKHRDDPIAKIFHRIERRRRLGLKCQV